MVGAEVKYKYVLRAFKAYEGVEVQLFSFLTSLPNGGGGEWSASRFDRFTPRKEIPVPGGWMGPQSGCGCFGEETYILPLSGFEPKFLGTSNLVVTPTELSLYS
jgi:hypothetical protein